MKFKPETIHGNFMASTDTIKITMIVYYMERIFFMFHIHGSLVVHTCLKFGIFKFHFIFLM